MIDLYLLAVVVVSLMMELTTLTLIRFEIDSMDVLAE